MKVVGVAAKYHLGLGDFIRRHFHGAGMESDTRLSNLGNIFSFSLLIDEYEELQNHWKDRQSHFY